MRFFRKATPVQRVTHENRAAAISFPTSTVAASRPTLASPAELHALAVETTYTFTPRSTPIGAF